MLAYLTANIDNEVINGFGSSNDLIGYGLWKFKGELRHVCNHGESLLGLISAPIHSFYHLKALFELLAHTQETHQTVSTTQVENVAKAKGQSEDAPNRRPTRSQKETHHCFQRQKHFPNESQDCHNSLKQVDQGVEQVVETCDEDLWFEQSLKKTQEGLREVQGEIAEECDTYVDNFFDPVDPLYISRIQKNLKEGQVSIQVVKADRDGDAAG